MAAAELQRAHQKGVCGKREVRSLKTCDGNYPEGHSDMAVETVVVAVAQYV